MFDKPLSRTNPTGQSSAGWMCQDCIKKKEPELYKNLEKDGDLKTTNDIFDAVNNKTKSCDHACSPSDYYKGGKCDRMGCYKG